MDPAIRQRTKSSSRLALRLSKSMMRLLRRSTTIIPDVRRHREMEKAMEYKHWCGNCQIRIYIERHEGIRLNWKDCPFVCEYKSAMANTTAINATNSKKGEDDAETS